MVIVVGFRQRSAWGGVGAGSLLLAAHGLTELWLRPRCTAPDEAAQTRRWAFAVTSLEEVREKVWDLGVKVARDSGEPDRIFRRRGGASLYVHDPDGNEIELVEMRQRTWVAKKYAKPSSTAICPSTAMYI